MRYESSPGAFRVFCSRCGSQLFMEYRCEPNIAYVTVGSLDSVPDRMPDRHFSYEEKADWFTFNDGLPRYREKSGLTC
jgi:hypothetical protein